MNGTFGNKDQVLGWFQTPAPCQGNQWGMYSFTSIKKFTWDHHAYFAFCDTTTKFMILPPLLLDSTYSL